VLLIIFGARSLPIDLPSVLWCCWLGSRKGIRPVKNRVGVLVWLSQLVCLQRGADLHTSQLMPLPLTVSCKIQIGFTFLVPAQLGSHGKRVVKRVCVCVCVCFAPYWPWCPYLDVYITSTVYIASYAIHANIEIDQTMPYRFTVLCKITLTTFDFKIFLQISTSMHKCVEIQATDNTYKDLSLIRMRRNTSHIAALTTQAEFILEP